LRALAVAIVAITVGATIAEAQQPLDNASVDRLRAAVQAPGTPLKFPSLPSWGDPTVRRFGIVTLLPPDTNGQFVRAVVPIGELAVRASRSVVAARHRRAERDARKAVRRDLHEYLTQRQ
jgi:hypothetical protein